MNDDTAPAIPQESEKPSRSFTLVAPPISAQPTESMLTLNEFCQQFSLTERRAVLLSAFHFEMRQKKRETDTYSAYKAAFEAFIVTPA